MAQTHVLLYGATGRMGRAIRASLHEFSDVTLRACVAPAPDVDPCPPGCVWMTPEEMFRGSGLPSDLVVIDVSVAAGTASLLDRLGRSPYALVSATTGLTDADEARVKALGSRVPVLRARNLSPGNSLACAMLRSLPRSATEMFDLDLIEHHHAGKRDAPSGTALAWASILAPGTTPRAGAGPGEPRGKGEIRVH
ncbi:MAG: hypothetical protein HY568_04730 [Candidatus Latescibacteria bacterium]|nr:hypothetical protein [Candidatus Latescibacterota bacterium]